MKIEPEFFLILYIAFFIFLSFYFLEILPDLYLLNFVIFFIILATYIFKSKKRIDKNNLYMLLILTILLTFQAIVRTLVDVVGGISGIFFRNFIASPLTLFIFVIIFILTKNLKK